MELISTKTLRLAFLGVGWIGKQRMETIINSGMAVPAVISDYNPVLLKEIGLQYPEAAISEEINFNSDLDGIVIATPNSLHAEQSIKAAEKGLPVFCQKPLGRTLEETQRIIESAKKNNVLLGVDFSYRDTNAFRRIKEVVVSGEIGDIFSAELNFHNAHGPGKSWCYDPLLSGGGAVIDLGIHLIDLLLILMNFPDVNEVISSLYSKGKIINAGQEVEDYASADIRFNNGASAHLTCSWNISIGRDAIIELIVYGTKGGAAIRNVNGSFFDFNAEVYKGNQKRILVSPPDDWMGRTAVEWVKKVSANPEYDASAEEFIYTAKIIDMIYGRL